MYINNIKYKNIPGLCPKKKKKKRKEKAKEGERGSLISSGALSTSEEKYTLQYSTTLAAVTERHSRPPIE